MKLPSLRGALTFGAGVLLVIFVYKKIQDSVEQAPQIL
jgi:hypothetical protein